jgi:hypothetical protein
VGKLGESWARAVAAHFGFLEAHGYAFASVDDSSFWQTDVLYRRPEVAVKITRSNEFRRVEVSIIRLVDDHVAPEPIWLTPTVPIHSALLDNVLEARGSELRWRAGAVSGLGADEVQRQLAFWAAALREVCPEFLDGDATAIDEVAAMLRAKVANHPAQLTIHLPDSASAAEKARAILEAQDTVPPEVTVVVNRYQVPSRRARWRNGLRRKRRPGSERE